ncbi:flagellin N-terminal helical domain-containing protein [Trichlorobacter lovleyi]|uniref:Flagellin domain protein n=1 Tax=Trichlorobacter lovleyi (strain ATCC BAA-1151 / DSM 17278 / SZ) TaxID=398767 RepID=B3EBN7_TRIL1|nr:flagellin [Trichlorobacter lovleyi]ACD97076.1 flagellin domain protein [Trichlorobacter lovleyi SZ]
MAIGDISLTSGMRSNLLSLQGTAKSIDQTQNRLSSGKRVNTPLDNPTNYFAAQGHVERASDLAVRKDGMAEAIQMVKAADTGIKGITSLIESAKGVATAALATSDTNERSTYSATFNTLLNQVSMMASDSGYRGINLLTNGSQTVEFGQRTNASTLQITGFNATAAGLTMQSAVATAWSASGNSAINSSSSELESALSFLRTKSSALSANLSAVTTRQDFTNSMINNLQTGADNLTLADTNEEGANMLMLQTRQNLGITSLSMASQAAQAVLKLF